MKGDSPYREIQGYSRSRLKVNLCDLYAVDVFFSFLVNRERKFGDGGAETPEL